MPYNQDLDAQSASVFENMKNRPKADTTNSTDAEKVKIEREGYLRIIPAAGKPEFVHQILNREVELPHARISLRIYQPNEKKNQPVLVYFHGGGFVAGGFETHEQMMCYLANHSGVTIVSVAYRLPPENKYPAAVNDAFDALQWIKENAAEFRIDPDRIATGGDSAGGTLSAVTVLKARDTGKVKIAFQLLFNPATDLTMSSHSWTELGAKGYILTTEKVNQFYEWYLPEGIDRTDSAVSPLFAKDFRNLPPTFISTASADPLKDEGEAYASKLKEAGVPVEHKEYQGVMHGFYQMSGVIDKGEVALTDAALALRNAINQKK